MAFRSTLGGGMLLDPQSYYERGKEFGTGTGKGMLGAFGRDQRTGEQVAASQTGKILAEALASKDPATMRAAAAELGKLGDKDGAKQLYTAAQQIESTAKQDARNAQSDAIAMGRESRDAINWAQGQEDRQRGIETSKGAAGMDNTTPEGLYKIAQYYLANGEYAKAQDAMAAAEDMKNKAANRSSLLGADKKAIREKTDNAQIALGQARGSMDLANQYEKSSPRGGILGNAYTGFIDFIGGDDAKVEMQAKYNSIRNSDVLQNLPPGAASDKDVEMVLKGWPGENSNPKVISRWLKGYAKIQALVAARNSEHAKWLSENNGDDSGFTEWLWSEEGKAKVNEAVQRAGFDWASTQQLSSDDLAELNALAQGNTGTNRRRSSRGR